MVWRNRLIVGLLILLQAGCARLEVQVDILDPAYVRDVRVLMRNQDLVRASANKDLAYLDALITEICDAYRQGQLGSYDATIRRTERLLQNELRDSAAAPSIANALEVSRASRDSIAAQPVTADCIDSQGEGFIDRDALVEDFLAIGCPGGECIESGVIDFERSGQQIRAASRLRSRLAAYSTQVRRKIRTFQELLQLPPTAPQLATLELEEQQAEIADEAAEEVKKVATSRGYLGANGRTLVFDELAFAAANAPEARWEERYNVARGFGLWGSTDMVIKLNDTADFSVAGLVFDARATAIAVRKLTTSALQLLASGQGLPIQIDTPNEEKENEASAIADANANVVAANARLEANELATRNYRGALRRVAVVLLQSAAIVEGTGTSNSNTAQTRRSEARQFAKRQFDANRPLLEAAASSKGDE